jgi:hypothetical protein
VTGGWHGERRERPVGQQAKVTTAGGPRAVSAQAVAGRRLTQPSARGQTRSGIVRWTARTARTGLTTGNVTTKELPRRLLSSAGRLDRLAGRRVTSRHAGHGPSTGALLARPPLGAAVRWIHAYLKDLSR